MVKWSTLEIRTSVDHRVAARTIQFRYRRNARRHNGTAQPSRWQLTQRHGADRHHAGTERAHAARQSQRFQRHRSEQLAPFQRDPLENSHGFAITRHLIKSMTSVANRRVVSAIILPTRPMVTCCFNRPAAPPHSIFSTRSPPSRRSPSITQPCAAIVASNSAPGSRNPRSATWRRAGRRRVEWPSPARAYTESSHAWPTTRGAGGRCFQHLGDPRASTVPVAQAVSGHGQARRRLHGLNVVASRTIRLRANRSNAVADSRRCP